jgi:c-di-GMP-binding flagellar brake protein YcgR
MSEDNIAASAAAAGHGGEVTEPAEIAGILAGLAQRKAQIFCSDVGADTSYVGMAVAADARQQTLRITIAAEGESGPDLPAGGAVEVFVPMHNADLVFTAVLKGAIPDQESTFDLVLPPKLQLWYRREHPRGPCFGLVEVVLRRSARPQHEALTAALRDISNAGLGISLPEGTDPKVRVGEVFDDCVLLLNGKPMAACAIEVLHTRQDAETGDLIAGARFARLDDVARTRIERLIAILDPLWSEPAKPSVDAT